MTNIFIIVKFWLHFLPFDLQLQFFNIKKMITYRQKQLGYNTERLTSASLFDFFFFPCLIFVLTVILKEKL